MSLSSVLRCKRVWNILRIEPISPVAISRGPDHRQLGPEMTSFRGDRRWTGCPTAKPSRPSLRPHLAPGLAPRPVLMPLSRPENHQSRFPSGIAPMRQTGFEPVTFGFVDRIVPC